MPFLKRNRKAFLNEKEKEMREKLVKRNEISRRILPDDEVISLWKKCEQESDFIPGIHCAVGAQSNATVKSNLTQAARKLFQLHDLEEEQPRSSDIPEDIPLLRFPIP